MTHTGMVTYSPGVLAADWARMRFPTRPANPEHLDVASTTIRSMGNPDLRASDEPVVKVVDLHKSFGP